MNNPLISVIVPVYKAEAYLEKSVKSIINQTYKNLEIILVDDGSPDRCGEMCDEFAKKDSRIRVIHKANGGQSSARNAALDIMAGDYVGFVDSDDWIEPNMYEHLYNLILKNNAQISVCGAKLEYLNGKVSYFNTDYPKNKTIRQYDTIEALTENFNNSKITYSLCDKLYESKIFSNLRFTEGKIYEDMEIIPKCLENADRIVYDPTPLYHYNLTEESTIRGTFNPKRFAEVDVALKKAEDYKIRYPQLYNISMASYIEVCLNVIHLSSGVKSCAQKRSELINILKNDLPNEAVMLLSKKAKIKFKVLRISSIMYEIMMHIYDFIKR